MTCGPHVSRTFSLHHPPGISIPTTLQEAAKVICQLKKPGRPKVPITIFLTPLASLRRKPIPFLPNLSNDRVADAERVVRHVDNVLRRLKKLDGSALVQLSAKYESSLSKILRHFEQNREDLKKALLTFLPLIDSRSDKLKIAEKGS